MSNLRYLRISFLPKLAVLVALCLFSLAPMVSATTVNCSGVAAWSGNSVAYAVGALVTYNGSEYKCLTAHTSNVSWDPVDAASLWTLQGTCTTGPTPTPTPKPTASPTPKPTPTATATVKPTASPTAKPTATATATATAAPSGFIFSPYKDVTVNANWNTGGQQSIVTGTVTPITSVLPSKTETWAFATGTCGSESWGGITPAEEATNVQAFVSAGKKYIVSTGGSAGSFDCPSTSGFLSFIQTYYSANMLGVDFDIELGQSQAVVDDLINAAKGAESTYPNMRFSFTIATLGGTSNPDLGTEGTLVVNEIKRLGLGGNYTVNLMVMDFGGTSASVCDVVNNACEMGQSSITAAQALNSQFGIPYSHMELTPDIGQNDTQGEIFTLADVDTMTSWLRANGLVGAHFWAFDRDTPTCSGGTNTCNGDGAASLAYTNKFLSDLGVQ